MVNKLEHTSAKGGSTSGGKSTTKSAKAPVKKPRAVTAKKAVEKTAPEAVHQEVLHVTQAEPKLVVKHHLPKDKYIFATGRRKTSVSNVRLFQGTGESVVNKIPFNKYFAFTAFQEEIDKPFQVTGLGGDYFFTAHVNGGGPHSQATALRHGIATALGKISEEVRKVLKKNGFLTRDDRKKERKKPGLKRARRSPQWAKR